MRITPETRIRITEPDGDTYDSTLSEFMDCNADDPFLVVDVIAALARGETVQAGGGAAPIFTIQQAP